jgi:hypothetical protein
MKSAAVAGFTFGVASSSAQIPNPGGFVSGGMASSSAQTLNKGSIIESSHL